MARKDRLEPLMRQLMEELVKDRPDLAKAKEMARRLGWRSAPDLETLMAHALEEMGRARGKRRKDQEAEA